MRAHKLVAFQWNDCVCFLCIYVMYVVWNKIVFSIIKIPEKCVHISTVLAWCCWHHTFILHYFNENRIRNINHTIDRFENLTNSTILIEMNEMKIKNTDYCFLVDKRLAFVNGTEIKIESKEKNVLFILTSHISRLYNDSE